MKATVAGFQRHKGQWLAAAIAYFTVFAVAPLIIIVVEIAGLILGRHQGVLDSLYGYLSQTAGKSAATGIRAIVSATFAQKHSGIMAQTVSWILFAVAAAGLFGSLQDALNTIWDVQPRKRGFLDTVRERAFSFAGVLCIAFLLLVALGANTVLTIAGQALAHVAPFFPTLIKAADFVLSFAIITVLFGLLFKYLPECQVAWTGVWPGAAGTALLFVIGQFLLGWYLGRAGISSTYGAFGGLVVFLLWVNYSAQIMLLGAEFTHAFASRSGSGKFET
ncbi:MAG: YihY/virulence factor BrkB family protein [Candidatus Eremiobacteraeota bacterium]|nr:YihY/virulence factor BrkB family protein [Candidatus Eremiobacteraeota bacterium]